LTLVTEIVLFPGDVLFIPSDGLMATFAFSLGWLFCGFVGL
jgi:ribosomal protein L16 Arg81 hydroxylase